MKAEMTAYEMLRATLLSVIARPPTAASATTSARGPEAHDPRRPQRQNPGQPRLEADRVSVYRSVCESLEAALTEAVAAEQRKRFGKAHTAQSRPMTSTELSRAAVLCQRADAFVGRLRYGDQLIIERSPVSAMLRVVVRDRRTRLYAVAHLEEKVLEWADDWVDIVKAAIDEADEAVGHLVVKTL